MNTFIGFFILGSIMTILFVSLAVLTKISKEPHTHDTKK